MDELTIPFLGPERAARQYPFGDLLRAGVTLAAGSAYVNHLDDTGSLRPGHRADLVVLDRNPFAGPAEAIADTRVALTYVDGARVHTAPDA